MEKPFPAHLAIFPKDVVHLKVSHLLFMKLFFDLLYSTKLAWSFLFTIQREIWIMLWLDKPVHLTIRFLWGLQCYLALKCFPFWNENISHLSDHFGKPKKMLSWLHSIRFCWVEDKAASVPATKFQHKLPTRVKMPNC